MKTNQNSLAQRKARSRNWAKLRLKGAISIKHLCYPDYFTEDTILTEEEISKIQQATNLLEEVLAGWNKHKEVPLCESKSLS